MKVRKIKTKQVPAHILNKKKRSRRRLFRLIRFILVTALFAITIVYAAISPFFNIVKNILWTATMGLWETVATVWQ